MMRARRTGWMAAIALAGCGWAAGARGGELPDAIGSVVLGVEPAPGMWMEYRVRFPVDALEGELRDVVPVPAATVPDQPSVPAVPPAATPTAKPGPPAKNPAPKPPTLAEALAKDFEWLRSEVTPEPLRPTAKDAPPPASTPTTPAAKDAPTAKDPPTAQGGGTETVAAKGLTPPAPPPLPPPTMNPAFGLEERRETLTVRVMVRAASPLTMELELRTSPLGPARMVTVPRVGLLAGAALESAVPAGRVENAPDPTDTSAGAASPGTGGAGRDAAVAERTGTEELALAGGTRLTVTTARYGAGERAVEVWTHPEVPFGVAALRTREVELTLAGHGSGTPPAFPLAGTKAVD